MEGLKAEAALKELKEAEALLMRRMRLIKIADRSDHGSVVPEIIPVLCIN